MNKTLVAVIATTLVVGPLSYEAAVSKPADTYKQLDLYADVFEIVRNQYFKPVPTTSWSRPRSTGWSRRSIRIPAT